MNTMYWSFLSIIFGFGLSALDVQASPESSAKVSSGRLEEYNPGANTVLVKVPLNENRVSDYTQFKPLEPSFTHAYNLPSHHESLFSRSQNTVGTVAQCVETMVKRKICEADTIQSYCQTDPSPMFQSCVASLKETFKDNCLEMARLCVNQPKLAGCMTSAGRELKLSMSNSNTMCSREPSGLSDAIEIVRRTKVDPTLMLEIPSDRLGHVRSCLYVRGDSDAEALKSLNECYMRHTSRNKPLIEPPAAPAKVASEEVQTAQKLKPAASRSAPAIEGPIVLPRGFVVFRRQGKTLEVPIFFTASDWDFLRAALGHVSTEMETDSDTIPVAIKVLRCADGVANCTQYETVTRELGITCEQEKSSLARNLRILVGGKAPKSGKTHQITIQRQLTSHQIDQERQALISSYRQSGFCP